MTEIQAYTHFLTAAYQMVYHQYGLDHGKAHEYATRMLGHWKINSEKYKSKPVMLFNEDE